MRSFLLSAVKLWYDALFHPSKLAERLNDPSLESKNDKETTTLQPIRLWAANTEFLVQYMFVILALSSLLFIDILIRGPRINLLVIPVVVAISYAVGLVLLPLGLQTPIILFVIWSTTFQIPHRFLTEAIETFPSAGRCFLYALVGSFSLLMTVYIGRMFSDLDRLAPKVKRNIFPKVLVGSVATAVGVGIVFTIMWRDLRSWSLMIFVAMLSLVFLIASLWSGYHSRTLNNAIVFMSALQAALVALANVTILLYGLVEIVTIVIAGLLSFVITGVCFANAMVHVFPDPVSHGTRSSQSLETSNSSQMKKLREIFRRLTLSYFVVLFGILCGATIAAATAATALALRSASSIVLITSCWIIAFSVAPINPSWRRFCVLSAILCTVTFLRLKLGALLVFIIILVAYFRVIPDYVFFSVLSSWWHYKRIRSNQTTTRCLHRLPPFSSELVWLPIPYHAHMLVAAFNHDPSTGTRLLQDVCHSKNSSLHYIVNKAIPPLVVQELTSVQDASALVSVAKSQHGYVQTLISISNTDDKSFELSELSRFFAPPSMRNDLLTLIPKMEALASNIKVALNAGSASLRARSLVNCLDELRELNSALPKLLPSLNVKLWGPVFNKWDEILHKEIDLQQAQAFQEVVNPFQCGGPLRREQVYLFKGRKRFVDDILQQLLDRNQSTLAIYGPRKCGKTSFLFNLPRLISNNIIPVYLSAQTQGTVSSDSDFCLALIKAIAVATSENGIRTNPAPKSDIRKRTFPLFEEWLDHTLGQLGKRQILICIDEFEKLGDALSKRRLTYRLFDELRDIFQRYSQINLLFAGVETLDELGQDWSSYFISLRPIEMVYLETEEAKQLITEPHPTFDLIYNDGIVEELVQLTRGHPYFLQLMGESLVKQANKHHTRRITSELLSEALESALIAGTAYFHYFWNECTGLDIPQRQTGRKLLWEIAHNDDFGLPDTSAQHYVLNRLKRYHVIEHRNGKYCFEVPLVERWVRLRAEM